MKTFSFILLLLVPFLAFTSDSLLPAPKRQRKCPNYIQQSAQESPFNCLPIELKAKIFRHVALQHLLFVCREWSKVIQSRSSFERECFFKKVRHFEKLFKSKEEHDQERYYERKFTSTRERNGVFSRVVASFYNKLVEWATTEGRNPNDSLSVAPFAEERIQLHLGRNRLIRMLPKMLNSDPKSHLFDLLGGFNGFSKLPLKVRRFLAANVIWVDASNSTSEACSLSLFLSSFHHKFEVIKECLVEVDFWVVMKSCVKMILGIDCVRLVVQDQNKLLDSIISLFPENWLIFVACSLREKLSPNLAITEISNVVESEYWFLNTTIFSVLQESREHVTADWCMKELQRKSPSLKHIGLQYCLLFDDAFLNKHGISPAEQLMLLQGLQPEYFMRRLCRSDSTNLDKQALVRWCNDHFDQSVFCFSDLVMLYALDDDPDALKKYSKSLEANYGGDLFTFSKVALDIGFTPRLSHEKKIALLKHLDPKRLADLDGVLDGDRRMLVLKIMSWLVDGSDDDYYGYAECVKGLSELDSSLLVEACLEHPEKYKMPPPSFCDQLTNSATHVLVKCIGNNVNKIADLQKLPKAYQIMVFLLTDSDKVADVLGNSETLKDNTCWILYYPSIHQSRKRAARAARRIHKHQMARRQQLQPNHSRWLI